jgi:guanylate kinase
VDQSLTAESDGAPQPPGLAPSSGRAADRDVALKPVPLVIHGPGGVGKDTVINRFGLHRLVSTTDREPRRHPDGSWERDGYDYYFVHPDIFRALVESDAFVEHADVLGYHKGIIRWVVDEAVRAGEDFVIRTDIQGAATWRRKMAGCVSVRMLGLPPSEPLAAHRADLLRRLEARGAPADEVRLRLDELEAEYASDADHYTVVNPFDDWEAAVRDLRAIVEQERQNAARPRPHLRA